VASGNQAAPNRSASSAPTRASRREPPIPPDPSASRQERGLKHRADNETRNIPTPPQLVRLLRAQIKRNGTTPDERIFQTTRGGILLDSGYNQVWTEPADGSRTAEA
jgi:hypothetical protein